MPPTLPEFSVTLPKRMQAVIGDRLGPPDCYRMVEAPVPTLSERDILVEVHACGMGYVDALVSRGAYQVKPDPPYCPGLEFAGRVAAVGNAVTRMRVGDRVSASAFGGGLAEYVAVPEGNACIIPERLADEAAAGFIVNYSTAWHGLLDRGQLRAGETVLVLGAAGGTGSAAVQVARLRGARVIAGASTEQKRTYALQHGAHQTVDYTQPDWRAALKELTDGRGVDVVFDPVGGELLEPAFRSLAWRGRHLVIGFAGGPIPALPVNLALLKGSALIGVDYRQFGSVYEQAQAVEVRERLFDAVERGDLTPPLGTSFAFTAFRDAMQLAASRDGVGKTTVRVRGR